MNKEIKKQIETGAQLSWQIITGKKYNIEYVILPQFYLGRIRAKALIPGVNPCLESEVYLFENFETMEEFFKELTGYSLK